MESEAKPMSKHSFLQNPVSQNSISLPSGAVEIQTARLDLVPVTPESLRCQVGFGPRMYADLGAAIHADIPAEWPPENWEPHVLDYLLNLIAEDPEATGWCRYLLLRHPGGRTLIGTFGCAFPKADTGQAELGYGLPPSWQRQGFAAEAGLAILPLAPIAADHPAPLFAQTVPESAWLDPRPRKMRICPCGRRL